LKGLGHIRDWAVLAIFLGIPGALPAQSNLLQDPGFELSPTRNGWLINPSIAANGVAVRSTTHQHSGLFSLELVPNAANVSTNPLAEYGVVQIIPAKGLLGKSLYYSGWLGTRDGAVSTLQVYTAGLSDLILREVRQVSNASTPVFWEDIIDIPNDPSIEAIIVACVVEGTVGGAYFDDLTLSTDLPSAWLSSLSQQDLGPALNASILVAPDQVVRRVSPSLYGINMEWPWDGQGLWNPVTQSPDPLIQSLTKAMGVTELRFPAGVFSDLYNWKDGVGPPASRPISAPLPGGVTSPNSFGTDEALKFADSLGANLLITVNVLSGTAEEAAEWVTYINTRGHHVAHWEVGNELYLDFSTYTPPMPNYTSQEYASVYKQYATAMLKADPTIQLGAGVEFSYSHSTFSVHPDWLSTVLTQDAPLINFISVHNAFAPVLGAYDAGWDVRTVYSSLMAAPELIRTSFQTLSETIDSLAGADASHISIAVTEWAPGFSADPSNRWVDHVKTLGSALYAASVMNIFVSNPRIEIADGFKLIDSGTQGWLGPRDGTNAAKAISYVLPMFTQHFSPLVVQSSTISPTYNSRSMGEIDAVQNVPYLDAVAGTDDANSTAYLMVVNRHFDRTIHTGVSFAGYCAQRSATLWTLNGTALDANTGTQPSTNLGVVWAAQAAEAPDGQINNGGPDQIWISTQTVPVTGCSAQFDFPAHSVTAVQVPIAKTATGVRQ
jgi:alpha-N-arabinofuranosidase